MLHLLINSGIGNVYIAFYWRQSLPDSVFYPARLIAFPFGGD